MDLSHRDPSDHHTVEELPKSNQVSTFTTRTPCYLCRPSVESSRVYLSTGVCAVCARLRLACRRACPTVTRVTRRRTDERPSSSIHQLTINFCSACLRLSAAESRHSHSHGHGSSLSTQFMTVSVDSSHSSSLELQARCLALGTSHGRAERRCWDDSARKATHHSSERRAQRCCGV